MKDLFVKFFKDESGATMVEYAVLVALIAAASITIIGVLGTEINDAFTRVKEAIEEEEASSE